VLLVLLVRLIVLTRRQDWRQSIRFLVIAAAVSR